MRAPIERLVNRLDIAAGGRDGEWIGGAGEKALNPNERLFGGLVVGQTIVAAGRFDPGRRIHSVHQVFLRGGRADLAITYRVRALFEGRTYSTLTVEIEQGGDIISHAQVGATRGIESPDRHDPSSAATPLDQTVNRDRYLGRPQWDDQPVEYRIDPARDADGVATLDTWIRATGPMSGDQLLHQAVLGYASDRGLMRVGWKPHQQHATFRGATLDHAIWFHRPVVLDEWHVHTMHSPTLNDGRGMIHGTIHHIDGTHVATTAQQGTYRIDPPT